jgi:hypothetical protein
MKRYGYILKAFSWLGETAVDRKTALETAKQDSNQPCVSLWARNMLRDSARPAGHSLRYRAQTTLQQAARDAAHHTDEAPAGTASRRKTDSSHS